MIHSTRISSFDAGLKSYPEMPLTDPITSDTGQLKWYHGDVNKGLVTIDTPRTQALVGFVNANDVQLTNLSADVRNDFCSIVLTSCDGKPIAQSRRLLLALTARSANTAMKWNPDRTSLENWGRTPVVIEPVKGLITLRKLQSPRDLTVVALNAGAKPLEPETTVTTYPQDLRITVGRPATTWYLIHARK
jgi:hypothetical protein